MLQAHHCRKQNDTDIHLLGDAAPIYALMTLEMNLGITCGCLSGVKPVLAACLPRLFGSSNKTRTHQTSHGYGAHSQPARTTDHQSLPVHPISETATNDGDSKIENAEASIGSLRNFAWASASGVGSEGRRIPYNVIQVQTVVMQEESNVSPTTKDPPNCHGRHEEWMMEDLSCH
jgi:hypothetical protein